MSLPGVLEKADKVLDKADKMIDKANVTLDQAKGVLSKADNVMDQAQPIVDQAGKIEKLFLILIYVLIGAVGLFLIFSISFKIYDREYGYYTK